MSMKPAAAPTVLAVFATAHEARRAKVAGVFRAARRLGWQLRLIEINHRFSLSIADMMKAHVPDGIIVDGEEFAHRPGWIPAGLPYVAIDPQPGFRAPHVIRHDSRASVDAAVQHLLRLGFDDYAFVGTNPEVYWSRRRARQFRQIVVAAGKRCHVYDRRDDLGRWLEALPKPCALHAAIDLSAIPVLDFCAAHGIAVPDRIAVIGSDNDTRLCESAWPTLSSVEPDYGMAGELAVGLLDDLLSGRSTGSAKLFYGPARVVTRASTTLRGRNLHHLHEAIEFIRLYAANGIGVPDVVRLMDVSRRTAEQLFRDELGVSILDEIQRARLDRVCDLLSRTDTPIGQIAAASGFSSDLHLKRLFKARFGLTMSGYRAVKSKTA